MKLKYTLPILCILTPVTLQAATVVGNLGGLLNGTGAATNGGDTRQFAWTTSGGEVTVTYTLDIVMAGSISLDNAYQSDSLFRRPGSGAELPSSGGNMVAGESLTITLDSIVANSGWTLNSFTKSNTVVVSGDGRDGDEIATFSVFDFVTTTTTPFTIAVPTASGQNTLTNTGFTAFDAAGDTLFFENTAGNTGKFNLQQIGFSFDVDAIPEPTSSALLLGGLGLLAMRRRR